MNRPLHQHETGTRVAFFRYHEASEWTRKKTIVPEEQKHFVDAPRQKDRHGMRAKQNFYFYPPLALTLLNEIKEG